MTSWMEKSSLSRGCTGGVTKDAWKEVEVIDEDGSVPRRGQCFIVSTQEN